MGSLNTSELNLMWRTWWEKCRWDSDNRFIWLLRPTNPSVRMQEFNSNKLSLLTISYFLDYNLFLHNKYTFKYSLKWLFICWNCSNSFKDISTKKSFNFIWIRSILKEFSHICPRKSKNENNCIVMIIFDQFNEMNLIKFTWNLSIEIPSITFQNNRSKCPFYK
jgi:hypothetical protein